MSPTLSLALCLLSRHGPLQLLVDGLDPGRDLLEFFSLDPGASFQCLANVPKFLGSGLHGVHQRFALISFGLLSLFGRGGGLVGKCSSRDRDRN